MTATLAFLKRNISWDELDIHTIFHYYRYASLLITSIFYFLGPPAVPTYLKLSLAAVLFIEAKVFISVYKQITSVLVKKILILIELVGFIMVLVFTGGLDSAFLWYAINPILLSTTLLPLYFCWAAASAFLALAFYLQGFIAEHPDFTPLIWSERAYIVLIFILVTLSAQLSNYLISRLAWQKSIMENQLGHIKSLYGAVEVFSHHSDPQEVANLFASYSKVLTGSVKSIIWAREFGTGSHISRIIYAVRGPRRILLEENWYPYVKGLFEDCAAGWKTDYRDFFSPQNTAKGTLVTVRIRSSSNIFGVLAAYFDDSRNIKIEEVEKNLVFLADLCAAALEKRYLESMSEKLLLAEEKDRIAREIHDTVSQNIFGLIHGLNSINQKHEFPLPVKENLKIMQKTARRCLQGLRQTIYGLKSAQSLRIPFEDELKEYLEELEKINSVKVKCDFNGILSDLTISERSALVRIIREACCNAIRHGGCKHIEVCFNNCRKELHLKITDDGCGFYYAELNGRNSNGLGLLNMKEVAASIGAEVEINSSPEYGTVIILKKRYHSQGVQEEREEVFSK